ncbi:MAG TPA: right-handed parallel beta-helix repeat-containing protein [Candidatus Eisenbacteria bacterium]|nr:right-handed parallel beta-helix repeat-containing protein [Candidatus Eisenbacteria bacterium]
MRSTAPPHSAARRGGVRVGFLALVLAAVLSVDAHAQTYYVDNQSPNASPTGPGTEANPYSTIASALAARKGPGITVVVKPGLYREDVAIPASGVDGNPYVVRAAGPGVVLDGSDDFSDPSKWQRGMGVPTADRYGRSYVDDNLYLAAGVTSDVQQVFVDGARLTRSKLGPGSLPPYAFTWIAGAGLYVNLGGDSPANHVTLVGARMSAFRLFSRSWVTIDGFESVRADDRAINVQNGCSNISILNNRVSLAGDNGIKTVNGQQIVIEGNTVSDCGSHGIALTAGAYGCTIKNNETFRNAVMPEGSANGIYLFQAPNNLVIGNNAHENQDTGIHFGQGSDNCIAYNNRSWNNGDHGYDHLYAAGTIHVNDVASRNYRDGFSIEGQSPNTQIFNCIAVDNGITSDEFNLWVNGASTPGFTSDHNIFWNSTAQPPIKYITTKYATIAAYQAASGQDLHSVQANPQFVNPPDGNFLPMSGSPAIDAGTSAVAYWPPTDAVGNPRIDDVATPDGGEGPVSYADIGALEFVDAPPPAAMRQVVPGTAGRGRAPASPASVSAETVGLTSFALSSANPSRGPVEFALDLKAEAPVSWEVFDVQGRMVWSQERVMPAGRTRLTWDGRTGNGEPAGTGVYMVRARVDEKQLTRRVVLF